MEKRKKAIIIGSVAVVAVSSLLLWSSQPHSYDDCILKNIDKANDRVASSLVHKACRAKFPEFNPFDQFDQKPSGR